MTNLTNVARLALRCGRVCYGAAFAGSGSALLGAVWFFRVRLALRRGGAWSGMARLCQMRRNMVRLALWCGGMSFALARPVMVLRDKAKYGGELKTSACLPTAKERKGNHERSNSV